MAERLLVKSGRDFLGVLFSAGTFQRVRGLAMTYVNMYEPAGVNADNAPPYRPAVSSPSPSPRIPARFTASLSCNPSSGLTRRKCTLNRLQLPKQWLRRRDCAKARKLVFTFRGLKGCHPADKPQLRYLMCLLLSRASATSRRGVSRTDERKGFRRKMQLCGLP